MFISNGEKIYIDDRLVYLSQQIGKLQDRVEVLESTNKALLKVATNKAKLDAEQSSVTVTVHAPHGLRKDGSPKKKPGPAIGSKRRVNI